jgi:hypothetical protein
VGRGARGGWIGREGLWEMALVGRFGYLDTYYDTYEYNTTCSFVY